MSNQTRTHEIDAAILSAAGLFVFEFMEHPFTRFITGGWKALRGRYFGQWALVGGIELRWIVLLYTGAHHSFLKWSLNERGLCSDTYPGAMREGSD